MASDETWAGIYTKYCTKFKLDRADKSWFEKIMLGDDFKWAHERERPRVDTGCKRCKELDEQERESRFSLAKKAAYKQDRAYHNKEIVWMREMYRAKQDRARTLPRSYMSWCFDGMGQWGIWLPIFTKLQGKDNIKKFRQKVTGFAVHGKHEFMYRTYHWVKCGANLTCTLIWRTLERLQWELAPTLYIQVRNPRSRVRTHAFVKRARCKTSAD